MLLSEYVGAGLTGPSFRSDAAKSGSDASRLISWERVEDAWGRGWTVGPGESSSLLGAEGRDEGGCEGCACDGGVRDEGSEGRDGYLRAAAPVAAFVALEADEPILSRVVEQTGKIGSSLT